MIKFKGKSNDGKTAELIQPFIFQGIEAKVQTVAFPVGLIDKDTKNLTIAYRNLDQDKKTALIPLSEGPFIMLKGVSFFQNYIRCTVLLFMLICFMGIIGCSAGSCFSSPVAIFVSFSYLIIGLLIISLTNSQQEMQGMEVKELIQSIAFFINDKLQLFMVSVDNFNKTEFLTSGRAITLKQMAYIIWMDVICKGLPLALISIFILNRRQLALVERK